MCRRSFLLAALVAVVLSTACAGAENGASPSSQDSSEPADTLLPSEPDPDWAADASEAPGIESGAFDSAEGDEFRLPDGRLARNSGGIIEVTSHDSFPPAGARPTRHEQDLIDAVAAAVRSAGWADYETALSAGFELTPGDDTHYRSVSNVTDGRVLDPERPEFLIFVDKVTGQGDEQVREKVLAGVMFLTNEVGDVGPQPGESVVWHFHDWQDNPFCPVVGPVPDPTITDCPDPLTRSAEMVHVWTIDHPEGRFATSMAIPAEVIGSDTSVATRPVEPGTGVVQVGEFFFDRATYTGRADGWTWVIRNLGSLVHEFAVANSADDVVAAGGRVEALGETTVEWQLSEGRYTFYCTVPGHREQGMEADVHVSPARSASTSGS